MRVLRDIYGTTCHWSFNCVQRKHNILYRYIVHCTQHNNRINRYTANKQWKYREIEPETSPQSKSNTLSFIIGPHLQLAGFTRILSRERGGNMYATLMSNGARIGKGPRGDKDIRRIYMYINCQRQMETPIDDYFHTYITPICPYFLLYSRLMCVPNMNSHWHNWYVMKLMWEISIPAQLKKFLALASWICLKLSWKVLHN